MNNAPKFPPKGPVLKLPPLPSSHPLYRNPVDRLRSFRHTFVAALEIRHDPQTERWTVVLLSRTTKEDVVVAWKQTEQDAAAWAINYGLRS